MSATLTDDELAELQSRLLTRTMARETCPFCINTNWFVLDRAAPSVVRLRDGSSYAAYTLACTNCGFVRQHLRDVLDGTVRGEVTHPHAAE